MTMREEMIQTAERKHGIHIGGFVSTDGEWCSTRTPEEFETFVEKQGFEVLECNSTKESTAVAITKDGYKFAWNGYCGKIRI